VSVSMYERLVWMQELSRSSHCIWMVNSFWIQQTSRLQVLAKVSSCKHLDVLPASIYQAEVVVIKVLAQQVRFFSYKILRL
jgi:hypothetical protein